MAANNAVLMGRFVRAPAEVFPNAALVDVANFRASRLDGRGIDDPKMREVLLGAGNIVIKRKKNLFACNLKLVSIALNADVALDGNRRHRHHRRRHPSEVKVAMMNREAPKGWDAKKIPAGQPPKSMCMIL